jgi:glycosyltransferase involved in cell wall biosynthesis
MSQISVIIPIYNCEDYLERCLDSLLNQTFCDWEALCVNDGSTDKSAEILDRYAAKDNRFKVIHKVNEGVSAARNTALGMVEGKYILFMDSDDFLHPQTMEICMYFAEKDDSDLVAYTYNRRYRSLRMIGNILNIPESKVIKHKRYSLESIGSLVTEDLFYWATEYSHPDHGQDKRWIVKHCQPWRCMYRTDKIQDISFIKGIIYEDLPWWGEVLMNIKKATIINLPLYYYYPNKASHVFSAKQHRRIESLKKAIEAAENLYIQKSDDRRRALWERKFLIPFKAKLAKKIKRYGDC